jgi:predicted phage baseplate assembly protein
VTGAPDSCGCDPLRPVEPLVENPPGQPALRWRVAPHSQSLTRMRAALGDEAMPDASRALARHGTADPAVALLDAWAVVADTVSFYTERIAQEGFLRTATELESVRTLARAIGYELRPGVAAQAEVAFEVESAPGAPTRVTVPAGTPVQSIPGQGQLPQVFETSEELDARAAWNSIPAARARPQNLGFGTRSVWLQAKSAGVRPGDAVLIVGAERERLARAPTHSRAAALARGDDKRWDFRIVTEVVEEPDGLAGWTRIDLEQRLGWRRQKPLTAEHPEVLVFGARGNLFGANAPDPSLIDDAAEAASGDWPGIEKPTADDEEDVIEVDGDQKRILPGSWIVLERRERRELYWVEDVAPDGDARFGVSGRLTRVRVDTTENLECFHRRETTVHSEPRPLAASATLARGEANPDRLVEPLVDPVSGRTLLLAPTEPPLPVGRLVLVCGFAPGSTPRDPVLAAATPPPLAEVAVVTGCTVADATMTVTLDRDLPWAYDPQSLLVRANVTEASHGETVEEEVLGSGDATATFQRLAVRRGPLTFVQAPTPSGSRTTLEVRVDGIHWPELESLDAVGPDGRVVTARIGEDGTAAVTAGDGKHGARLPTGAENVRATYRVGVGADGALGAGQLALLPRRPLGISAVTNPAPTHDWAVPEQLSEARTNAPLRVRTLDRVVSVADHSDFAADFAGVSLARADRVWDGQRDVVVVSVHGTAGRPPGDGLLAGLTDALALARDPGTAFVVLPGELVSFGVGIEIEADPACVRADVEAKVRAALSAAYAYPAMPFATALPASRALVTVRSVAGVRACTIPKLHDVGPGEDEHDPLAALPARFEGGVLLAAQAVSLVAERIEIEPMAR